MIRRRATRSRLTTITLWAAVVLLAPWHGAGAQPAEPGVVGATGNTAAGSLDGNTQTPLPGKDPVLDERVKAVSKVLRCPVCQGESIQDSPADLATQMKALVREQMASGQSEEQVLDYFVAKYGQWILLEPRAEGINLLVYWLPVVFLVLGTGLIVVVVKKWTKPVPATDV